MDHVSKDCLTKMLEPSRVTQPPPKTMLNLVDVVSSPTTSENEGILPLRVVTRSQEQRVVQDHSDGTDTQQNNPKRKARRR